MDRRREKRLNNLGVIESFNFHTANQTVEITSPLEISLIDISTGGLGIKSNTELTNGTTLSINIQLEEINFVVIGKIVWCTEEEHIYNCGLKLIYLPSELQAFLSDIEDTESKYIN